MADKVASRADLVCGQEEDIRISEKDVVCAIPMVNVKVHNHDPLQLVSHLAVPGCNRNVVHDAEAHWSSGDRMVTWRPHNCKASCTAPI